MGNRNIVSNEAGAAITATNAGGAHAAVSADDGNVVINGGTISSGGHGIEAYGDNGEVTMNGGSVTANNGHAGISIGDNSIRVDGNGNFIILEASANIVGAMSLNLPNNTLIDRRPAAR